MHFDYVSYNLLLIWVYLMLTWMNFTNMLSKLLENGQSVPKYRVVFHNLILWKITNTGYWCTNYIQHGHTMAYCPTTTRKSWPK